MSNRYVEQILRLLQAKEITRQAAHSLIREVEKGKNTVITTGDTRIAVVGMSCRMPMADSIEFFWKNLAAGQDCIREFPAKRRQDTDPYLKQVHPDLFINAHPYWAGGFLDQVDQFDNEFFNILPGEAKYIDPQQRLFLEVAYEALEDAGYAGTRIKGTKTGIYIGHCDNEYMAAIKDITPAAIPGNLVPFLASRIAYVFDLNGPAISIATTCSSSLVALHTACQALRTGDCEMALVGAANLHLFPVNVKNDTVYTVGITSQDNRCRTFDSKASGVVRGEGSVAFLLKPYEKAIADRDQMHAVILGSAINNDGHSSSLTAPNPLAQANMIKEAWANSKIDPETITYIEAHGTGTKLGDPLEIQAITRAFSEYTARKQFCGIGSLKTNIGHLVSGASGIAGVLKAILSLKHRQIPATLHFQEPNPLINFKDSPVYVVDKLQEWSHPILRTGVSAFGFNGTNCHVILERSPENLQSSPVFSEYLLPLSANSWPALLNLARSLLEFLNDSKNKNFLCENLCFSASVGRTHRTFRVALVFRRLDELISQLQQLSQSQANEPNKRIYISNNLQLDKKAEEISGEKLSQLSIDQIAEFFINGKNINWESYYRGKDCRIMSLPHYPYERKRFWIDEGTEDGIKAHFGGGTGASCSQNSRQEKNIPLNDYFEGDPKAQFLAICAQVLGLDSVNIEDDFFTLGGDSLLGIQLINALHNKFHRKITLDVLFESSSLKDIFVAITKTEENRFKAIKKVVLADKYEASSAQKRLWLLDQMQDERNAYNMYDAYVLTGELNVPAFAQALENLVSRHESLRTTFAYEEGVLFQKIANISKIDFRQLQAFTMEEACQSVEKITKEPFESEGKCTSLFRAFLIHLPQSNHQKQFLFGFVIHHAICDGWSLHLLIRELLQDYQKHLENNQQDLPNLHLQYKDYSAWQKEFFSSEAALKQERYWLEKLHGQLPICEIKGDRTRPAVFNFKGDKKSFRIVPKVANKLRELAKKQQVSLYMALLSSVYLLLYRYNEKEDLIIGSPVSGRSHFDLKGIVGCFINTLAMRIQLNPQKNFLELLQTVKHAVLEAFENQDYLFEMLVDKLRVPRDTSRSPIFNINVVLQNIDKHVSDVQIPEVTIVPLEMKHDTTKWDLEFEFSEKKDGSILCLLEYYTGIYSPEMIQILIETYLFILETVVEEPSLSIALAKDLPDVHMNIISRTLSPEFNPPNELMHNLFTKQAAQTPNAIALRCKDAEYTYNVVDSTSTQIAQVLAQHKIGPGSLVGILMDNSAEVILSMLGILKAGAAYVPLDVNYPQNRLKTIIEEANIHFIISLTKHRRVLDDLQWTCPNFNYYLTLDDSDTHPISSTANELMNEQLWDYVAGQANNDIEASGWVSSYTGLPFSLQEMQEYTANTLQTLKPYLSSNKKVLEIGCGSGLTLENIAPHVGRYVATDLSQAIVQRSEKKAKQLGFTNTSFKQIQAHAIDSLDEGEFDIIILNSVIHCFPDLSYLKTVLKKAVHKLSSKGGIIFLGDLMDLDKKKELLQSLSDFKRKHEEKDYKTKTEFNSELFVSRKFLEDLQLEMAAVGSVKCSRKEYTIENELSLFRFDAILEIHANQQRPSRDKQKHKYQLDWNALRQCSTKKIEIKQDLDSLAYVLFTSGSTGVPKGVCISHKSLVHYISWANHYYFKEDKKLCFPFYSSISFDLTLTSIFCTLLKGGTISVYAGDFDQVLERISADKRNNVIKLTPAHLSYVAEGINDLSHIKKYIIGGDALYGSHIKPLSKYGNPEVYNEYGPTEATVGCIVYKTDPKNADEVIKVPIGLPIANTSIYILNSLQKKVPIGAVGELYISGIGLAVGYLNHQKLTSEKFIQNPFDRTPSNIYKTGDLARFLPSGEIEYLGRADRQIKHKSFRIELDEIENILKQHPEITDGIVVIDKDAQAIDQIIAYYSSSTSLSKDDLRRFLSDALPEYMVPQMMIPMASIPLTINGKIDIKALPKPGLQLRKQYRPPQTNTEAVLVEICEQLFNIQPVGIDEDFFELGGDSITAMRLLAKAKQKGVLLAVKDVFQHRTIMNMAQHTKSILTTQEPQTIADTTLPLTPIQHWFFEQNFENPNYFNMGYLFQLPSNVNIQRLEEAMKKCIAGHPSLRANYDLSTNPPKQWIQSHPNFKLQQIDLKKDLYEIQSKKIQEYAEKIQQSLDLSKDLLVVGMLFDMGQQGLRLLIIVHHLVIDGVSWRILAEDIQHCYQDLQYVIPKTASPAAWVQEMFSASHKGYLNNDYWRTVAISKECMMPSPKSKLRKDYKFERLLFSKSETLQLLLISRKEFQTSLQNLLLAAFFEAWTKARNIPELWINLESPGRTMEQSQLDISHTVGWFTALYPVLLKRRATLQASIQHVKEIVENIPDGGIAYSIERHLLQNPLLKALPPPQVLFNYFGQVEQDLLSSKKESLLQPSRDNIGSLWDAKNALPYLLETNAIIIDGELQLGLEYHAESISEADIRFFLMQFKDNLDELLQKNSILERA